MKKNIFFLALWVVSIACTEKKEIKQVAQLEKEHTNIIGTWKLFYGEVKQNDTVQVKDVSNTDFIKIINKTHFAFFNQKNGTNESFYGGAGTYSLDGNNYKEKLSHIGVDAIRGHEFSFTIEIKGDTLIQYGLEEVKQANSKRVIIEKYSRIK